MASKTYRLGTKPRELLGVLNEIRSLRKPLDFDQDKYAALTMPEELDKYGKTRSDLRVDADISGNSLKSVELYIFPKSQPGNVLFQASSPTASQYAKQINERWLKLAKSEQTYTYWVLDLGRRLQESSPLILFSLTGNIQDLGYEAISDADPLHTGTIRKEKGGVRTTWTIDDTMYRGLIQKIVGPTSVVKVEGGPTSRSERAEKAVTDSARDAGKAASSGMRAVKKAASSGVRRVGDAASSGAQSVGRAASAAAAEVGRKRFDVTDKNKLTARAQAIADYVGTLALPLDVTTDKMAQVLAVDTLKKTIDYQRVQVKNVSDSPGKPGDDGKYHVVVDSSGNTLVNISIYATSRSGGDVPATNIMSSVRQRSAGSYIRRHNRKQLADLENDWTYYQIVIGNDNKERAAIGLLKDEIRGYFQTQDSGFLLRDGTGPLAIWRIQGKPEHIRLLESALGTGAVVKIWKEGDDSASTWDKVSEYGMSTAEAAYGTVAGAAEGAYGAVKGTAESAYETAGYAYDSVLGSEEVSEETVSMWSRWLPGEDGRASLTAWNNANLSALSNDPTKRVSYFVIGTRGVVFCDPDSATVPTLTDSEPLPSAVWEALKSAATIKGFLTWGGTARGVYLEYSTAREDFSTLDVLQKEVERLGETGVNRGGYADSDPT